MTRKFNIQALLDNGIQTRVQIDATLVTKYAELMRDGTVFPPVSVVSDGTNDWLVDGFHRAKAALECAADEIEAEVTEGTKTDALKAALIANAKHGSPRNEGDLKKVLEMAWQRLDDFIKREDYKGQDPVTGRPNGYPSAQQLASITGISRATCARFMEELRVSHETPPSAEKRGGDGVTALPNDGRACRPATAGNREVIGHYLSNPDCKLLGVTATPDRRKTMRELGISERTYWSIWGRERALRARPPR